MSGEVPHARQELNKHNLTEGVLLHTLDHYISQVIMPVGDLLIVLEKLATHYVVISKDGSDHFRGICKHFLVLNMLQELQHLSDRGVDVGKVSHTHRVPDCAGQTPQRVLQVYRELRQARFALAQIDFILDLLGDVK